MPKLVQVSCPNCGAGMRVEPLMDLVTCNYCQLSSVVHRPGGRKTPLPPPPPLGVHINYGHISVPEPSKVAGVVLAAVLLLVVGIGAAGALMFAGTGISASGPGKSKNKSGPVVRQEPQRDKGATGPATPSAPEVPRIRGDLSKIDLVALVEQSRELALARNKNAKFVGLVAFNAVGGHANLSEGSGSHAVTTFEYLEYDKSQPAGKDKKEGSIMVIARDGKFMLTESPSAMHIDDERRGYPLIVPTCRSTELWRSVASSGVPIDAVATIHIYGNKVFTAKSPTVWSIRVDGHDEYRREVDARSCEVVKNWGKK
jgi:hypothetical protein